jgi:hypothetical protein
MCVVFTELHRIARAIILNGGVFLSGMITQIFFLWVITFNRMYVKIRIFIGVVYIEIKIRKAVS